MNINEIFQEAEQLSVLNEMYFGKPQALYKIEDLFDKFKSQYKNHKPLTIGADYKEMIKDPILKKIGEELCNTFGFNETMVTIVRDASINAYTISFVTDAKGNSYNIDSKPFTNEKLTNAVVVTNSGFNFNKKKFKTNLLVCLNLGILFNSPITTPELIAILMHEVGHNFSKVIIKANKINGRMDEKFADQFVAMYGYGPELVSAFSKMTINYGQIEKHLKDVPIINIFVGLNKIVDSVMFRHLFDDPHPNMYSRMESQIRQLEAELKGNRDIDPKMKKEIEDQIEQCKKTMDDYFSNSDNMSDKMLKYYHGRIEPNHNVEQEKNKAADRYAAPETINDKIDQMYKRKGFFKLH